MRWHLAWGTVVVVALIGCGEGRDRSVTDDDDGGVGGTSGAGTPSGAGAGATSGAGAGATTTTAGVGGATTVTTGAGGGGECENGPLAAPIAGCAPEPPPSTGDFHQDCVDRINQFRWVCQCLPPLERWTAAESCSDQQSQADEQSGEPHGSFPACGENAQNTCPGWGSEGAIVDGCLQMMWDEGPGEPFSEHGHYLNMSSTSYKRVACGISVSGGWSNQNFAP